MQDETTENDGKSFGMQTVHLENIQAIAEQENHSEERPDTSRSGKTFNHPINRRY